MKITTSPKIWSHHNRLTLLHQANQIFEWEAGEKSEALAVYWELILIEIPPGNALQVTVVNANCPRKPFILDDVADLQALRKSFRQWCSD